MPKGTVSPRRLSRARPTPSAPSHTNSVSSNSSTRAERNTRSHNKASSPQKSSTPQSLSSPEPSEQARAATSEPPQLRRSRRQLDNDDDPDAKTEDAGEDDIIEDEETTRCLCGQLEYPGPPNDTSSSRGAKGSNTTNQDEPSEERGGLFIQCDRCEVWQHGGCVSIMEESAVPDNYYCEECKPELHEVLKTSSGQKFSHYLPVWSKSHPKAYRKGSVDKDDKGKFLKEKERLARPIPEAGAKRRSTMNSRAAYDEDEVLRKVLEESKTEGPIGTENGSRKGKRFRDDSEDVRSDVKRQRTASSVISSHSDIEDSGEDSDHKALKKAPRGTAAKSQRDREIRDRDKDRTEAANKRKGRADRRRGEESDVQEPDSTKPSAKASPVDADTPDTPNLNSTASISKRGGKRPGPGRGKNLSNQAPTPADEKALSPQTSNTADGGETPIPAVTVNGAYPNLAMKRSKRGLAHKEESGESDRDNTNGIANGFGTANGSDVEKSEGFRKKEPSMSELKRRAAAMLEWVERAKDEMARTGGGGGTGSPGGSASPPALKLNAMGGDLGLLAEGLHTSITGWQVEYGGA